MAMFCVYVNASTEVSVALPLKKNKIGNFQPKNNLTYDDLMF